MINKIVKQFSSGSRTKKPGLEHIHIEPVKGWISIRFNELWQYRELLYFLTWRDIKIRYKQTILGAGWAVLQPLLTMVIFTIVFGNFAKVPSNGLPYPIFSYAALLPWQYFASAVNRSGVSLVMNTNLISKVYFPRLLVPLSATLAPFVDFAIAFMILLVMMFYYGMAPTWGVVLLPAFLFLAFLTALAVSLWLCALDVKYRDVAYVIPFFIEVWMFISPVAYSSSIVPEQWRFLFWLNPMTGVIEGFRWALLGNGQPPDIKIFISLFIVLVLLITGLMYFQRVEKTFADVI
jgi:lipopolysaccharide transport system permease protein